MPVCPTCSECGRHPASDTGLEQAVAAPSMAASSSTIPQFSGPFIPRPAETTNSASGNGTVVPDELDFTSLTVTLDATELKSTVTSATVALFSPDTTGNEFGNKEMILI